MSNRCVRYYGRRLFVQIKRNSKDKKNIIMKNELK